MKFLTVRKLGSAAILVGLGGIAVWAFVTSPSRPASQRPPSRGLRLAAAGSAPVMTAPTAAQIHVVAGTFGVFSHPARPGDSLPAQSAYKIGTARQIGASSGPVSAWAVVTGEQICVTVNASTGAAAGGPAACNTPSELAQPNQLLATDAASSGSNDQVIAGLVPDGVTTVTISFQGGSSVPVAVSNNGFTYSTPSGRALRGFSWTASGMAYAEKTG